MVRTNQGGSVLSFVIIAVIMAILLIGGVYFVRQQTATNVPQASHPKEAEKTEEKPAPATSQQEGNNNVAHETTPAPSSSNEVVVLPQTGPAEAASLLLAVGLITGVGISYLRSRRPELSL